MTASSQADAFVPEIIRDGSSWEVTYQDLPSYKNSLKISYYVTEVIPEGIAYTADYGAQEKTFVTSGGALTNRDTSRISVPVKNEWADGAKGDKAVIFLTANGSKTGQSLELDETNDWRSSFDELPRYDENGAEIEYGVLEETQQWTCTVKPDGRGGFLVTNYPKEIETEVPKTGDSSNTAAFLGIALASAAGVFLVFRKKRMENS